MRARTRVLFFEWGDPMHHRGKSLDQLRSELRSLQRQLRPGLSGMEQRKIVRELGWIRMTIAGRERQDLLASCDDRSPDPESLP